MENIDETNELEFLPIIESEEESVNNDEVIDETNEDEQNDEVVDSNEEPTEVDDTALAFYEMLEQKNILNTDREIKSWDDIEEELQNYPNKVREEMLGSTPEKARALVDYVLTKGASINDDDLKEFYSLHLEDVTTPEVETNEQAREVLKAKYKDQFPEETIDIILDDLEDKDQLIEKAKGFKSSKASAKLEEIKLQEVQRQQQIEEYNNSIKEEFEQLEWKKQHKTKVFEQMHNGHTEQQLQSIANDPKAIIQLANLISYYDPKTKSFDLSTFVNQANTSKTVDYRERIKSGMQNSGGSVTTKSKDAGNKLTPVF